jgi:threonine/homoserine/homoserine lactone efflux protein
MLAVIAFPFCALMILFAARLADGLRRAPRLMRIVDWAFAGVFGAFAVRLLLTQRQ